MSDLPLPPKKTAKDRVYEAAQVGVALVPFIGGSAQAALDAVFGPPIDRRRQKWFEQLWELVTHLAQLRDVSVEELIEDENFVTSVIHATAIALGQHVEAKIDMLKAVLEHGALDPDRSDIVTARYLRWVDELDVEHVTVLRYAADPAGWYKAHNYERQEYMAVGRRHVLDEAGLDIENDILALVLSDLSQRGLADSGMLTGTVTGRAAYDAWITLRGTEWLRWITLV